MSAQERINLRSRSPAEREGIAKRAAEKGSHLVSWESPTDQGVKAMVEAAVDLLKQAEIMHGQPLYYDAKGRFIEVGQVFRPTIGMLDECIKAGSAGGPWR